MGSEERVIRVSLVTASYNGAPTLHRVLESLEAQTFRDFEWIVVDDASSDETAEWVEKAAARADFPVRLERLPENCGRPSAVNQGIALARGEFVLTADDDDRFVPEALEVLVGTWDRHAPGCPHPLAGVVARCVDQYGRPHGDPFPEDVWIADVFEERYGADVKGEKWRMTRSDVRREHPLPAHVDRFVRSASTWFEIGLEYKSICINDCLRIYYRPDPGRPHVGALIHQHPFGLRYGELQKINRFLPRINGDRFLDRHTRRAFRGYVVQSLRAGVGLRRMFGDVEGARHRAFLIFYLPFGAYRWVEEKVRELRGR